MPEPRIQLGPFVLERPLGEGGMGQVWAAEHVEHRIAVAVKVITTDVARDSGFRAAFRTEVRRIAGLDHPGIVMVLDFGEIDRAAAVATDGALVAGSPYMVMERASGGSLAGFAPSSFDELSDVLFPVLSALAV